MKIWWEFKLGNDLTLERDVKSAKKMVQSSNRKDTAGILLPMVEKQKMELLDGRFLEQPQKQQGNLFL